MSTPYSSSPAQPSVSSSDFSVPETAGEVVAHEPRRLHQGVADRRAHEREAPLLEILAHRIGHGRACRYVHQAAPDVPDGSPLDEPPDVRVEAAELVLHPQESTGVLHG